MQIVRAERWHQVDTARSGARAEGRRCSVCGAQQLRPRPEAVFDGVTRRRYRVVRCAGCGYDLLEPLAG
jgi:ribosomal protein S27E